MSTSPRALVAESGSNRSRNMRHGVEAVIFVCIGSGEWQKSFFGPIFTIVLRWLFDSFE